MSKQINKIVDNYPVLLNRDEKDNLVKTLSSIILEVAPGGGGGGKTYYGADGVYVDNDNNRITLESTAKNAIDNIPHTVGELTDSANYQTVAGMSNYLTTATYQTDSATFLTQTSATQNLAPISVTGDIEDLKSVSGDFNNYYTKDETDVLTANVKSYAYNLSQLKQDKLTFEYDSNDAISSINHSALAGQGGTTYTEGNGISIDSNTISISADYIQAITSVSSIKGTILTGDSNILATSAEVGNNIKWTLQLTAQPTVTDTTLSGYDGIVATKDGSISSQWNVGIAQAYKEEIEAVSGKLTKASADTLYAPNSVTGDVDTLKSSSGNWDKVSDKLDTTAFSDVSGSFLTAHQSLADYYTKTQVDSTFASATQLNDYLTTSDAATTYQPKGEYASASDIVGMATQTWVGEQGFYTKASGDNDYAPKSVTSTVDTLTGASAGWNEVTSKLDKSIYSNASGNWEASYNVLTSYSAAGTWLTAHQSLTNYYTKDETSGASELSDEFAKYVTSSTVTTQGTDYVMTTTGWKVLSLPGGGMTQVIHDDTLTGQGNADNSKLGLAQTAYNAITSVSSKLDTTAFSNVSGTFLTKSSADNDYAPLSVTADVNTLTAASAGWNNKVDKPTSLNDKYLVLRTDSNGAVSGWEDLKKECYSKTEATGTFVATANIDTTTLSGDGKTVSTKLGVKTDVIATKDYVNSSFLPLSGGEVSGQLVVSGGSNFDQQFLKLTRENVNGYGRIGLGSSGPLALKVDDANSHTTQINISPNATYDQLVQVQHGGTAAYLIPAVTATTTAGLTNDGILHIILES